MYASHFGLAERPFSLAPDPRYFYLSDAHREALAHLLYGIGEGGSFVLLTGEVGTGKTTVCRALLERLPADVDVAMIFNPRLTAVELLSAVCDELGAPCPAGTTSLKAMVDTLFHALLDAHGRGRRTVLILDEAQSLGPELLEEIRLLTNLETTREKLLQVILIGQPELAVLLDRPELRQLAQRVTARYHLRPFSPAESRAYVQHRLEIAGQTRPVFGARALGAAHRLARGIPRLLNTICDRALLGAYATGRSRVTEPIVRRAAREVYGRPPRVRWGVVATTTVALVLVAGAALALLGAAGLTRLGVEAPHVKAAVPPPAPARLAPEPARRAPTLGESLADPAFTSSRARAFAALYALWHLDVPAATADLGCGYGRAAGLRCMERTGTWTVLRRLNLPAILPLAAPGGDRRWVVLAGLGGDRAALELGDRRLVATTMEVERFWDGPFVVVWKPPVAGPVPLKPGMGGEDVVWLRRRLAAIEGRPLAVGARRVYDEDLRERVAAFQRAEALTPDGIAGEETLVRLAAGAGAGVPSLSPGER